MLIVGAGPAGLTAALELSRMGIAVRIVDNLPVRSATPQAVVMHSQTLALLQRRGVNPEMLRDANQVAVGGLYRNGTLLGKVPLTRARGRYPFSLLVRQAETERILLEQLARQGVTVERTTKVIALAQAERDPDGQGDDQEVRCILRHHDGRLEEYRPPYLISADGTCSTVRRTLDPSQRVKRARHAYLLADLHLDGDLPDDEISIFLSRRGLLAVFPLGARSFRCLVTDPQARYGDRGEPAADDLRDAFAEYSPTSVRPRHVTWSCRIPAGPVGSPVWRRGRIFFGGDAAHAYRPASGQGMDSGIQDMINLSWKLAMVLHGEAAPELLQTYSGERLPVLRRVEKSAETAADLLGATNAIAHQLVTRVAPYLLDSRFVLRLGADLAGEVISDYQQSPLSAAPRGPGGLQPGDGVPDIRVLAGQAEARADARPREMWLHELLDPSHLTLLFTAATASAGPPEAWQEQLRPCPRIMQAYQISPVPDRQLEQSRFTQAFGGRPSLLLIRPDSYVGFAGQQNAMPYLATWLSRWFPAGRTRGAATSRSARETRWHVGSAGGRQPR